MAWFGYDISNHQGGTDINARIAETDFLIFKATEGTGFVDPWCDTWVQACITAGHPWGFYHFARENDAKTEADFFVDNTHNYFGFGIPVLDWETTQDVDWVNRFVKRVHERTGIWPWIYANPWRFQQGGVEENCGRWVASYPGGTPDPSDCPAADGISVACWQYTSTPLDSNYFYGGIDEWNAYARGGEKGEDEDMSIANEQLSRTDDAGGLGPDSGVDMYGRVVAIDGYAGKAAEQLTRTDDPTGRGQQANMYDRVAWMAAKQESMMERQEAIEGKVDRLLAIHAEAEVVVEADEIAEATVGD